MWSPTDERKVRQQHHFSIDGWDVSRLIELVKDLPVTTIPIPDQEVDTVYWFDDAQNRPTVRKVIHHIELIEAADLSYPIILGADGRIMDGMHRIAKALLRGRHTIEAVRFEADPEPDFPNCNPTEVMGDG